MDAKAGSAGEHFFKKVLSNSLKEILESDMLFGYEYDFGSTTELAIKVLNYYNAPKQSEKVMILSRNNPPEFQCSICGEHRASWINAVDIYVEEPFWCDECADKLEEGEFDEEIDSEEVWLLPVTNSPRMGVCGYEGSSLNRMKFVRKRRKKLCRLKNEKSFYFKN